MLGCRTREIDVARRGWRWAGGAVAGLLLAAMLWEPLSVAQPEAAPRQSYDVTITRDRYGVPHIVGRRDADVGYGLAWAHAEDDFTTLQEVFASVRGRSGALLGPEGAKLDVALELTRARAVATRDWPKLPADLRALILAYAQGLNDYAAQHPAEVRLRQLFPVTGEDVVAGFVLRSPFFFGLDRVLAPLSEGRLPPRDAEPVKPGESSTDTRPVEMKGSNAFAVTGRRSGDGVTRLIVNSHQPWTGPVAWWEVVVHSGEGWDFAGALFPGAPYPLLGHNRTLGWANTVNRPDLIDVYRLTVNGAGSAYRLDGRWVAFESKMLWLKVRFGPFVLPVPHRVKRSIHGPAFETPQGQFAIRYAGQGESGNVEQYYRLNRARDFAEWRAAMAKQGVVATNFVYADAAGHIAFFYNAKFPDRAPGYDWRGIVPGDTSKTLWTRYRPFTAVPALIDPVPGWVANSNNTPFVATAAGSNLRRADFAPELGIETYMTNRAWRFGELLADPGPIDRDRLLRTKFDKGYSRSGWAGVWMAKLLGVDAARDGDIAAAQALLRTWDWTLDGIGSADSLAALLIGEGVRKVYRGDPLPEPRAALVDVVAFLRSNWQRLDPPYAELARVRRGKSDVSISGGPDALRAYYWRRTPDGRLAGFNGDSFIMLVEWDPDGRVRSQSVQPFGSAIERPKSVHYADQSRLFAAEKWKPVLFDARDLAAQGGTPYRPG
ncbi:penicillin acylase family protein [Sandaracinobacteroides saxicola]|uniref:Penicillin acylase family protein n=1 Tax=Sandaracinobacteroides saxicola TaxID=2759707 RepID=A0A7G5IMI2_9SPHN|nr:penicillin acylase family protein [Sandaracinobacteroides saxicola]